MDFMKLGVKSLILSWFCVWKSSYKSIVLVYQSPTDMKPQDVNGNFLLKFILIGKYNFII